MSLIQASLKTQRRVSRPSSVATTATWRVTRVVGLASVSRVHWLKGISGSCWTILVIVMGGLTRRPALRSTLRLKMPLTPKMPVAVVPSIST